jgi:hypothetical protein
MRRNKVEKSHIHILELETLRRETIVTEYAQEIVNLTPYICEWYSYITSCQHLHTLCGEERRRKERRMSRCFTWFPFGLFYNKLA